MRSILLVYKQHRFEVLTVLVIGVFLVIGSVVEGYRFSQVHLPANCDPYAALYAGQGMWGGPPLTAECMAVSQQWLNLKGGIDMSLIPAAPWMVPLLFGILLGAGLVSREIETGTAPLSWALVGSRRRWLLHRMAAMLLLLVPLMLALGFASDYFDANLQRTNPWAAFQDYAGRGVILVFWGLAAFAGTVALSTLFGRTLPAFFVALLVCLVVRGPWEAGANRTFLPPVSQMLVSPEVARGAAVPGGSMGVYDDSNAALVVYFQNYLDGQPWAGDPWEWWNAHPTVVQNPDGSTTISVGPTDPTQAAKGPYSVPFGFFGSQYWFVIALESAILMAGSLLCAGVGLFWLGRRRPY